MRKKNFIFANNLRAIKQELGDDDHEEIEVMREKLETLAVQKKLKQKYIVKLIVLKKHHQILWKQP